MAKGRILVHEFVEFIPDELNEGSLYVCMALATVVHKCCCGCGNEVVTPLSPTDWKLTYEGRGITLYPSIGNWGFRCRSHYWIKNGRVKWVGQWSQAAIEAERAHDRIAKRRFYDTSEPVQDVVQEEPSKTLADHHQGNSVWQELCEWMHGLM